MTTADEWDARAELDVAVMIARYLRENPPPEGARFADDLEKCSSNLCVHGHRRLDDLGTRQLRSVS